MKVQFYSAKEWCAACRKMYPTYREVAKRFEKSRFTFEEIDVESDRGVDLSSARQVRNVPTILILDNKGKELERLCGTQTYEALVETLKKYMK